MADEKKATYIVSNSAVKFMGKWYFPHDRIDLTAKEKKQIEKDCHHVELVKAT